MLKLTDIKKDYKVASEYVHALKGVSLDFRKSEFVCILGPSGCGKTTLLNIIGGLDHYTSGDLVIQGKSTKDFTDRDWDVYRNHRIGFIFQSYNLIPHQTVLGNVEIALTIAGVGREERKKRATQALERVGLGKELHKRPNQLSGGQCQRVAIARALVNNPDILLADEPTGALDSETSVQIMELIKEIAAERLVIMVTHNPELAERYASRLVRFKDGFMESDSNPYDGSEESASPVAETDAAETAKEDSDQTARATDETQGSEQAEASEESVQNGKKPKKKKEKQLRARMNFLSSLALSARNLLTKKGRTVVTSIAGSIGIISVCLVLALSSGFNSYIKRTEEDMLSYYPVQVTESTYDMASIMTSFTSEKDMPDMSQLGDKVYIDSFLTGLANQMSVKNNITPAYLDYIEKMDPAWYHAIQYGYGVSLSDNLFTSVQTGGVKEGDEIRTDYRSLANLKEFYISELQTYKPIYSSLVPMANYFGNIVTKMPGSGDLSDVSYGKYVLSQYEIVGEGHFPRNEREAVLVVGSNNEVSDLTLAQLGLLDEPTFISLFEEKEGEEPSIDFDKQTIPFDEIVGKEYVLYYNNEVYGENTPTMENPYPYTYEGKRDDLNASDEEGIKITVTGILRLKKGLTYGCLASGLNLTEATVERYIAQNIHSDLVRFINENSQTMDTDLGEYTFYFNPPAQNLAHYYTSKDQSGVSYTSEDTVLRHVGGDDFPNAISVFASDFDGKDELLEYLDIWNDWCESGNHVYEYMDEDGVAQSVTLGELDKITYSDTVGLLMGMMQTMLDVITYVLVAFTAISLIVSSVMIGIITYVSVVERIKEIGVLRSLGARKQDIRNLFNAETFIIGLAAGLFGVVVTYLLSFVINAIIFSLAGIAGIAALPPLTAFVMVCVSVLLTLISGLIPAQAAAKKDPVIALRTE